MHAVERDFIAIPQLRTVNHNDLKFTTLYEPTERKDKVR